MANILSCNVTVMVSNLDIAIDFYTHTLGFLLKNRYGNHWADVEGPGIALGLHPTDKPVAKGDNLQIGLRVEDIQQAMAELKQKGVQFSLDNEEKVRLASFSDPDGNILYLPRLGRTIIFVGLDLLPIILN